MGNKPKIDIPKSLIDPIYETQTETLQVTKKKKHLSIGIAKETTMQERRVALVPAAVSALIGHGHHVVVESGEGDKCSYSDHKYSEAGAKISHSKKEVFECDVLVKAAPPSVNEIELMHPNMILISPLHLPGVTAEYIQKLKQKRVIALAMEYIKDGSENFPIVSIISQMAGISAILTAAELLNNNNDGKGVLFGGIAGVPPAKAVILGAGVVAEFAVKAALGLGAEVRIFDNNIYKLARLQNRIGRSLNTSSLNPQQLQKELISAEVAIGAVHSKTGRTPVVVTEEMVASMKDGSVIVDVSIDQGGCFATSRMTSHDKPTFIEHGIIHYCVPNIASNVARTASIAVSNILTPLLLNAGSTENIERLLYDHPGLRHGVYTYKGCLTNEYLGRRLEMKATNLDLLITSN
ncbi:MAG: alanine dehydrogenase, partial [Bacteroidia bacterium]|nr:alanine dehydrogenase [Bacteroidia bacterium]